MSQSIQSTQNYEDRLLSQNKFNSRLNNNLPTIYEVNETPAPICKIVLLIVRICIPIWFSIFGYIPDIQSIILILCCDWITMFILGHISILILGPTKKETLPYVIIQEDDLLPRKYDMYYKLYVIIDRVYILKIITNSAIMTLLAKFLHNKPNINLEYPNQNFDSSIFVYAKYTYIVILWIEQCYLLFSVISSTTPNN